MRIMTTEMRYKTFVLYLGAAGCVRLVPVQYHTTIATGPLAYTLVSGQRQVLLRSLDDGAWTESWSSPLVAGPRQPFYYGGVIVRGEGTRPAQLPHLDCYAMGWAGLVGWAG